MTVLSAEKLEEYDDFVGTESYNTIKRGWLLKTDGADAEDHEIVDDAISNGFLPPAGGALDTNTLYRARNLKVHKVDPDNRKWIAEVTYDNKPAEYSSQESGQPEINSTLPNGADPSTVDDPTQDPPIINFSGREEQFPLWVDVAGRPIINTAFNAIEPVPMGHFQNRIISIETNSNYPTDYSDLDGSINFNDIVIEDPAGSFQVSIPALYGLVKVRTSGPYYRKASTGTSTRYWKNTFEIEERRVYIASSAFTDLQVWSYANSSRDFNRYDTTFATETINGVAYKRLPWGDYLGNVGFWRLISDTPAQYSSGSDYEVGDRVYYDFGLGVRRRFSCQKAHGANNPQTPVQGEDTVYWNEYAYESSGFYQQRILFNMIDPTADAEHAVSPIDTPAWLTSEGAIRREDETAGVDPFIYLYQLTHIPRKWETFSGFPGNTTTTT